MAHRAEVVDLVGLGLLDDPHEVARVGEIAVVQFHPRVLDMRILIDMVDPLGVEQAAAALDAVHDIAFLEQELREV